VLEDNPQGAVKFAQETVDKLLRGKVTYERLIISKGVAELHTYENQNMEQVKVAKKIMAMGYEFTPNMKISWVKCKRGAEPVIEGVEFTEVPDYKYYAQRLSNSLARITEVFGCDADRLMQGLSQRSLDSFGDEGGAATSLADFM
jgi:DNA polymerase I